MQDAVKQTGEGGERAGYRQIGVRKGRRAESWVAQPKEKGGTILADIYWI